LVVNNAADDLTAGDGQCTLREAILNANADADTTGGDCAAGSGADEIHIPSGYYLLNGTASNLLLTDDATLIGAGADLTIIDAGAVGATLLVGGVLAAIDVIGVTVTGGFGGIVSINGGGDLTLIDTVVSGNSGSFFGGIFTEGSTTLIRSTVSGNSSASGVGFGAGGILSGGTVRLYNSTVSGNHHQGSCSCTSRLQKNAVRRRGLGCLTPF
jgi:CSLREA domain-containing protein